MADRQLEGSDFPDVGDEDEEYEGENAAPRTRGSYSEMRTTDEDEKVVPLVTNFVRLVTPENILVHEYHIEFYPDIKSRQLRYDMVSEHIAGMFAGAFRFDLRSNLKTTIKLPEEQTRVQSTRSSDSVNVEILIKYTDKTALGPVGTLNLYKTQAKCNLYYLKFVLIGRGFFNSEEKIEIPEHKISVWRGLHLDVIEHEHHTFMVFDNVFQLRSTVSVYSMLVTVVNRSRSEGENWMENCRRELAGVNVMTTYNNKTYTVDDFEFDVNPMSTFQGRDGPISFVDYFKQHFDIQIGDTKQPMILCLPTAREIRAGVTQSVLLVPELCYLTSLTGSKRKDPVMKKLIGSSTRSDPTVLPRFIRHVVIS